MIFNRWFRSTRSASPARRKPATCRLSVEPLEPRDNPSSSGLLDPTFGSGGVVLSQTTSASRGLADVSVLPDGRLLAAGWTGYGSASDFAAARYAADGSPDPSFGSGGMATVDFKGQYDRAMATAVQPGTGGKILVAGIASNQSSVVFGVARLNPNGTLDTSFGDKTSKGKVTSAPDARNANWVYSMAVYPDGRFVLAGVTSDPGYLNGSVSLARFNANGTPDTSFGNKGTVVTSVPALREPNGAHAVRVALDAGGRLVVSSRGNFYGQNGDVGDFMVARLNPNGTPDTTFGAAGTGIVRTDLTGPGGADYPYALALQGDGKIVVGGLSQQPNSDVQPTVVRYNANGTLDATFDGDGITVVTPMPGTRSGGRIDALAVQPDGRIVAVGSGGHAVLRADGGYDFFDNDAFVTRLNPDGSRDASYGPSGTGTTITEFGSSPYLRGVALQPDGRVVAVGNSNNGQSGGYLESFVLIRLSASTAAPPVQVGSFVAPGTVPAGSPLALTADGITTSNPGATVTKVAFYVIDSFGVERFLGYGAKNAGGAWTLTSTAYLPPGPYTLLALAADSTGTVSDPLSLSLQVV